MKKNICILGSTGSIGKNSLEVIRRFGSKFRVISIAARNNISLLEKQASIFHPSVIVVSDPSAAESLRRRIGRKTKVLAGPEGLAEIASDRDTDIVINALVGFAGLHPTIAAIRRGKTVALANKETLVVAGELIMPLVKKHRATLIPIDSEHSAIMQCLNGESAQTIRRIILTASGGPFLNTEKKHFSKITVEEALNHPKWRMGKKISIDSATLMNKGLEVIEACWLFGLPPSKIDVVVHPQSIIHSMVEFVDGSVKAQLSIPDMKIPILYALSYPGRFDSGGPVVDFPGMGSMTFGKPDGKKFECLQLAYDAIEAGGTMPAALNAANEVAVEKFLSRKLPFHKIPKVISSTLEKMNCLRKPSIDEIGETDRLAREIASGVKI